MKKCTCEDWAPNIEIINNALLMSTSHSWGFPKGYTGKFIEYCPWCGKKLIEAEDEKND